VVSAWPALNIPRTRPSHQIYNTRSVKELLAKIRAIIKAHQYASAGHLIVKLNPIIRGWANYHRYVVSKKTFTKVDHEIFQALWRWARRRHSKKNAHWIKAKYFRSVQRRHWVFFGWVKDRKGNRREVQLIKAAKTPIKRHIKIRSAANPYDPKWEHYFEKRLVAKMATDLMVHPSLFRLWRSQNGVCPMCQDKITRETGWEIHHIIALINGGPDTWENRVLIHPTCHRQAHCLGLAVLKPRPTTKH
jgi:RNA-directed DNA polymerase